MLAKILTLSFVGTACFSVLTGGAYPPVPMFVPYPPAVDLPPPSPPPLPHEIVRQEPPKPAYRTLRVLVTACSPEDPIDREYYAANGFKGRTTRAVAAYKAHLPVGTMVAIPGYHNGSWVKVDSAGGGIIRRAARRGIVQVDVKFPTYAESKQWGRQWLTIKIKED